MTVVVQWSILDQEGCLQANFKNIFELNNIWLVPCHGSHVGHLLPPAHKSDTPIQPIHNLNTLGQYIHSFNLYPKSC